MTSVEHIGDATLYLGDCVASMQAMPAGSVQTCVTSPPYFGLRAYLPDGHADKHIEIGLEATPDEYVAKLVAVFREVRRVLADNGCIWVNLGDSYNAGTTKPSGASKTADVGGWTTRSGVAAGALRCSVETLKVKDLIGIPWMVAFALRADGWYLRQDIIWHKPNPMPESVTDRCTKAHEYLFLLSKQARYYFDADAIREPHCATVARAVERYAGRPEIEEARRFGNIGSAPDRNDSGKSLHIDNNAFANPAGRNRRSVWTVATAPFNGWSKTVRWVRVAAGAACDGTRRRASEDCPAHGRHDRQGDGHGGGQSSHNHGNGAHHGAAQHREHDTSSMCPEQSPPTDSSDYSDPSRSPSATDHSNGSRRTGLGPETTSPCTPSAERTGRIDDRLALFEFAGPHPGTLASRTWPDAMAVHEWDQTPFHTVGTSSLPIAPECICAFYQEETKETSHFATFPPDLIEPCILAGTSAYGCCVACGAPWQRCTERIDQGWDGSRYGERVIDAAGGAKTGGTAKSTLGSGNGKLTGKQKTTGWRPTCSCAVGVRQIPPPVMPCVVLDPFAGSGTTGAVALKHGRRAVLCELNEAYAPLIRERLGIVAGQPDLFLSSKPVQQGLAL